MNKKLIYAICVLVVTSVISFIYVALSLKTKAQEKEVLIEHQELIKEDIKVINVNDLESVPSREQLLKKYLDTIQVINKEQLPFDEPRIEYGQQDGKLRPLWINAYMNKQYKYHFNGVVYYTFYKDKETKELIPNLPQVCSDYITDSLERSLGNWYNPSIKEPKLIKGKYSIRDQAEYEGLDLRKLNHLITFFQSHPEYFEFVFNGDGPKIGKIKELKQFFIFNNVEVGDIGILSGKVPWDQVEIHSHSFIVTKVENGFVTHVSGNAGMAREWSINSESYRTPLRRVKYIIRLKNEFLEKMY